MKKGILFGVLAAGLCAGETGAINVNTISDTETLLDVEISGTGYEATTVGSFWNFDFSTYQLDRPTPYIAVEFMLTYPDRVENGGGTYLPASLLPDPGTVLNLVEYDAQIFPMLSTFTLNSIDTNGSDDASQWDWSFTIRAEYFPDAVSAPDGGQSALLLAMGVVGIIGMSRVQKSKRCPTS